MDTGAGAKHGNGQADSTPSGQSAVSPGPGAAVPAPTNGKHHTNGAAAAAPAKKTNEATRFKSGDERQNPGGVCKVAREARRRLSAEAKKSKWVFDDKTSRWRHAKKGEAGITSEAMQFEVAANAKDNGRTMAKLMDKVYPDATPIAAQVQISNVVPVQNNANDARRNTPQLADPTVRASLLGFINALDDAGGYTRNPGAGSN